MAERRYSDEETAAIFKAASELQQAALSASASDALAPISGEGMTLAQLQEIGREVGIPADLVARAANGLERRGRASVRRFLGLPIGVGRTVSLQRKLSQEEWERLVVDLRETFDARGHVREDGGLRQWTNGNLQALLEPTPDGHRLRLQTLKGDGYAAMALGLAVVLFDVFLFALEALEGRVRSAPVLVPIGVAGLAMVALGALRIPGWAKVRQKQMEDIAARLTETSAG